MTEEARTIPVTSNTKAQLAALIHTEVGTGTYTTPPTTQHSQLGAALKAAGVLKADGTYVAGKGLADTLSALSVPTITSDVIERAAKSRGLY